MLEIKLAKETQVNSLVLQNTLRVSFWVAWSTLSKQELPWATYILYVLVHQQQSILRYLSEHKVNNSNIKQ